VKQRPFLALWTIAVIATVAAFVVHLGLRGRVVDLGYKLGKARAEQARLREVKRVLELEAASYETPQRVERVARTLLGMAPPSPERILPIKNFVPSSRLEQQRDDAPVPVASGSAAAPATSAAPEPSSPRGSP
jgi:cell division protein FtsL